MTDPVQAQDVVYFSISTEMAFESTFSQAKSDGHTVMIVSTTPQGITAEFSMGKEEATKLTKAVRRVTSVPKTQESGFVFGLRTQGKRSQHTKVHVPAESIPSFVETIDSFLRARTDRPIPQSARAQTSRWKIA